jgi:5-methylcytosine-specific restriction endonuclease McrA
MNKKRPLRLSTDEYQVLWASILARDGWRCQCCGSSYNLHVHHVTPRGRGGDDAPENLITLCADCHSALHAREISRLPSGPRGLSRERARRAE